MDKLMCPDTAFLQQCAELMTSSANRRLLQRLASGYKSEQTVPRQVHRREGDKVVDGRMSASGHRAYRRRKYQTVAREAPANFVADLRRLRNWPSMKGSLWRRASIVKLTHALNARLVTGSIGARGLRVLDVGCGTGCIS
jgi:2-polyprenyl-3-methyl-5-hydroxy-6-metoxy-1,4-benzoquinol methylase